LAVVRHTRADEEAGRAELVGAGAVGRSAPLAAAVLISSAQAGAIALVTALALGGTAGSAAGAFGAGLSVLAVGLAFAAVGAVTAQLCGTGRAANGWALAVLGAAYLLRAAGDSASATGSEGGRLSDLSPIGWVQLVRPYSSSPRWWALALPPALTVVLLLTAGRLRARRDLGSGLLAARPGPGRGSVRLAGPFALAWRLQRATVIAWLSGLAVAGALVGAISGSVSTLVGDSAAVHRLFAELGGRQGLADAYLAAAVSLIGLAVAAYAVQSVLRLRGEEEAGRAEPLLAGPVSRTRLALSHWSLAAGGALALAVVLGLTAGLADGGRVGPLVVAALAEVPGAWVLAGIAAVLVAVVPRQAGLAWAALALAAVLGQFGAVLQLPGWVQGISPFDHVPHLPDRSVAAGSVLGPALAVALVALVLGVAALAAWRRRDVPA
jgi:ABC-2 type transport system permease protein